jgi:hypothetical protein
MTLHVLRQDEAVIVSRGGRLRVVAPSPQPCSEEAGRVPTHGVHVYGYPLRYELPSLSPSWSPTSGTVEEPVLLCRGLVEGTSWDIIHRDLVAWCKGSQEFNCGGAGAGEGGGGGGGDVASYLLRHPEHGGAFWMLARDADGVCFARTDTLGREPLLVRKVTARAEGEGEGKGAGEGGDRARDDDIGCRDGDGESNHNDWVLATAPGGAWPAASSDEAGGWSPHHPRHVLRIDPSTGTLDPTAAATTLGLGLLPLLPKLLEPPPPTCPAPVPGTIAGDCGVDAAGVARLKIHGGEEEGTAEDNEGMRAAATRLVQGLMAAVAAAAAHSCASPSRPMGVLFSGGVDSTGILAVCLHAGVPCIAITAAFTASSVEPADVGPARAAAAALGGGLPGFRV